MVFYCYCLKFSSNDYSYLKAVSILLDICLLTFVQKCDILLGGGSNICDSLWQGEGG